MSTVNSYYHPISLVSVFKFLENLVKIQLLKYLEENNVLTCFQYGFRVGKKTPQSHCLNK